jgi:hypothetical protein
MVKPAIAIGICLSATGAFAAEAPIFKDRAAQESYAIGAQTAKTLRKDKIDIDIEMLVRGFRDGVSDDVGALRMSDKELKMVMSRVQQDVRKNMVLNRREQGERARTEGPEFLASHALEAGVLKTPSGVQYQVIQAGKGAKPELSSTVLVRYRGVLLNGYEFDASPEDGSPGRLVVAQTIAGLKEVLQMMPVGAHWKVVLPAALGYGDRGRDAELGPHEVLRFDIELIGIEDK